MPDFVADSGSVFLGEISACNPGAGISLFRKANGNSMGANTQNTALADQTDGFLVYPNPTTGSFRLTSPINGEFTILNALGEELYNAMVNKDQQVVFDLASHSKGIYFVRISNSAEIKTKKILLE